MFAYSTCKPASIGPTNKYSRLGNCGCVMGEEQDVMENEIMVGMIEGKRYIDRPIELNYTAWVSGTIRHRESLDTTDMSLTESRVMLK